MELYIASYPEDKVIPELLFRQGQLYYEYAVYDPAVRQWGLLLEKYPDSKYARGAGELILDSFNKSEDYENIETWARRLRSTPAFEAPDAQARLVTLIVQAVFKQGEQHAAAGHHDKAALAYLRATKEFPKEKNAAKAAVNAEVEAKRAGDLATLTEAADLLIANHKGAAEVPEGAWIAASTFQSLGLFSKAADYHDVIATDYRKSSHHKDAAVNSVLLRTTVGEHSKAIESGNRYRRAYPNGADADEALFLMGKAHEKAESWKDAERLYNSYSRTAKLSSSRVEALVRLANGRSQRVT
jgi:TolA-binding protein